MPVRLFSFPLNISNNEALLIVRTYIMNMPTNFLRKYCRSMVVITTEAAVEL
jgi:hypothetical protein